MPLPAARSRSASVPCGTSSASTSPASWKRAKGSISVGRVAAVKEHTTFRTRPFSTSIPMSGIRGWCAPPVVLDTQVRFRAPCASSARIRL